MIALTSEQISARRRERAELLAELKRLSGVRTRLRVIDQELISGQAIPAKGTRAEQLTLDRVAMEEAASEAVEHNRREDIRRAVLDELEGGVAAALPGLLRGVAAQFSVTGRAAPSEAEIAEVVAVLVSSSVLVAQGKADEPWYRLAPRSGDKKLRKGQKKAESAPLAAPLDESEVTP